MSPEQSWALLLVDDDEDNYLITRDMLSTARRGNFRLEWAPTYEAGRAALRDMLYDAVIVDYDMGARNGLELIHEAVQRGYPAPFILFTGRGSYEIDLEAMRAGVALYISKDEVNPSLLERTIRYGIERKQTEQALAAANEQLLLQKQELEQKNRLLQESAENLRVSEERFHSLFSGMTEGFALHEILCDENGVPIDYRFLEINPAFERLTGLKRAEVIGRLKSEVEQLRNDDPKWLEIYGKVALTGEPIHFENYSPALRQHFEVFSYRPAPGQFAVIFLNITERKRIEEQLKINLAKYSVLFETFPMGITVSDPQGKIIETNEEALRLLSLSRTEHTQRHLSGPEWHIIRPDGTSMPPEEYPSVTALKEQRLAGPVEMGIVKGENEVTWISVIATPLMVEGYGVVITYSDITERVQAEEALQKSEIEQREIATQVEVQRRLNDYREKERQEIGRNIHDGPIQTLIGSVFNLQYVRESFPDPALDNELGQIHESIKDAIRELRQVVTELRPPALIRFGIVRAIRGHAEDFSQRHPTLDLHLRLPESSVPLAEEASLALFRIYQEGMNNVARHARAKKAWVCFTREDGQAILEIRDNGCGFTLPRDLKDHTQRGHFGLVGMQERAEAIGGELQVTSSLGSGTTIRVRVPLEIVNEPPAG